METKSKRNRWNTKILIMKHVRLFEDFKESILSEKFILQDLENEFNIELDLYDHGNYIQLDRIIIPKEQRGSGIGSKVMQRICDYADDLNKDIYLTPDASFGASSVNRLKRFYKHFDFIKNKDNKYKDSMVRYAK
jgi:predicted GNAT family N-acyltransferase